MRVLNIGGFLILEQEAKGEYEVNFNGTGLATFIVKTLEISGVPPFGVTFPDVTIESFSFVVNRPLNEIQFIGRSILVGFGVIRGVARRQ